MLEGRCCPSTVTNLLDSGPGSLSNYPKTHRKLNLGFSEKADYYSS
jgi:hypothetical protein